MNKWQRKTKIALIYMVLMLFHVFVNLTVSVSAEEQQARELSQVIRGHMVARTEDFIVEYLYDGTCDEAKSEWKNLIRSVMEMVFSEEESIGLYDGDYLAWNYDKYQVTADLKEEAGYTVITMNFHTIYYTSYEEEQYVKNRIRDIMYALDLKNDTEYEKVRKIKQYVCDEVDYDNSSKLPDGYKYTAYAALKDHKCVCQGYALLFHVLCKYAGIESRIIVGKAGNERHAWNIVRIGDYFYNVDVTWDGQGAVTKNQFFLKCDDDFNGHTPAEKFLTEDFLAKYPKAMVSLDEQDPPVTYTMQENILNLDSEWQIDQADHLIMGIREQTTLTELEKNFSYSVIVTDKSDKVIDNKDQMIGTGKKIYVMNHNEDCYQTVVKGDLNGDSVVDLIDVELLQKHLMNLSELQDVLQKAAILDTDRDTLSVLDMEILQKYILGIGQEK